VEKARTGGGLRAVGEWADTHDASALAFQISVHLLRPSHLCVWIGSLFTATVPNASGTSTYVFSQRSFQTTATTFDYNGPMCQWPFCSKCDHGGRAFLGLLLVALIVLIALLCVSMVRIGGGRHLHSLRHAPRTLLIESWLSIVAILFYALANIVFGATCYHAVNTYDAYDGAHPTGLSFTIACCFLLLLQQGVILLIRRDPSCQLGPWMGGRSMNQPWMDVENGGGGGNAGAGDSDGMVAEEIVTSYEASQAQAKAYAQSATYGGGHSGSSSGAVAHHAHGHGGAGDGDDAPATGDEDYGSYQQISAPNTKE